MEQAGLYRAKVEKYKKALTGFNRLFEHDMALFDPVITDAIMNGQLQKFEYCSELMWKAIRLLIRQRNKISPKSPRDAVKEFFNCGYINSSQYETMIQILDDRNKLSHVYNEDVFTEVYSRIGEFKVVMNDVLTILEKVSID
ncbi:MAG: nucleotidyltransferase substrate binding protein [Ignavibacteria bacterium]|nr:nucleotidyltransferase substrate binding protein [Ignavibacteria bacterium]MCC7158935.1 nucleotidyltransferase substrate binding protein [Ignavibacteria bacterium]